MSVNHEKVQSSRVAGDEGNLMAKAEAFVGRLFEAYGQQVH